MMNHFIDESGNLFGLDPYGSQDGLIKPTWRQLSESEFREIQEARSAPKPPTVLEQIRALESQVTQRRLREALLGTDGGWLAGIDAQIAALRAQL